MNAAKVIIPQPKFTANMADFDSKMNADQEVSHTLAMEGHSFMLTGSCGTGKTFAIRNIVQSMRKSGRKVLLCASTGKLLQLSLTRQILKLSSVRPHSVWSVKTCLKNNKTSGVLIHITCYTHTYIDICLKQSLWPHM